MHTHNIRIYLVSAGSKWRFSYIIFDDILFTSQMNKNSVSWDSFLFMLQQPILTVCLCSVWVMHMLYNISLWLTLHGSTIWQCSISLFMCVPMLRGFRRHWGRSGLLYNQMSSSKLKKAYTYIYNPFMWHESMFLFHVILYIIPRYCHIDLCPVILTLYESMWYSCCKSLC